MKREVRSKTGLRPDRGQIKICQRSGLSSVICLLFILLGVVSMAAANENCTTVIVNNYETKCIDGYEWLVKYEKFGCHTAVVPVAQKFAIYPKANGKPKMSLPVPCTVEE